MSRYYDDELYHHGVKGMKWGQHIFGKASRGASAIKGKIKDYRDGADDRKARKTLKKASKSEARAERKQAAREKRLEQLSKSPTYLWKHKDAYTTEELNKALNRINTEQRIHEASMKELKRGKDICDTIIGYGKTVNDAYNTINNLSKNYSDLKSGKFGKELRGGDDNKKKEKKEDKDSDSGRKTMPYSEETISSDDVSVEPGSPKRKSAASKAMKWATDKANESKARRKERPIDITEEFNRRNRRRSQYPALYRR